MPVPNPCYIASAVADAEAILVTSINARFLAFRRLASLLELAQPPPVLAIIGQLIPISKIDINAYIALQQNCPMLGLPRADRSIQALQNLVDSAYTTIANELLNHPWWRLKGLETGLARFLAQNPLSSNNLNLWLKCVAAVCETTLAVSSQPILSTQFLTPTQADKTTQISGAVSFLTTLRS